MIQAGRAEARQSYAAWKAEQERLALEQERAEARQEYARWKQQPTPLPPEHEHEREWSKTYDLKLDQDHRLSR